MWADGLEGCVRMLADCAMGSITSQMRRLCTNALKHVLKVKQTHGFSQLN